MKFKLLEELKNNSSKSLLSHKHSAVILSNSVPISWNHNTINGKHFFHAEYNVVRKFLIQNGHLGFVKSFDRNNKKNVPNSVKRLVKNLYIIVIRVNNDVLLNSKPCKHCVNFMKKFGIKKILYSDNKGNMISEKTREIKTVHITLRNKNFYNS